MVMNIDITKSSKKMEELQRIERTLGFIQFKLEFLRVRGLLWNLTGMENVMKQISRQIDEEQAISKILCNAMENALEKYKRSEVIIMDYFGKNAEDKNIAFDDRGRYGGDQGRPQNIKQSDEEYEEIADIIRKYYPDYTNKDIKKYLKKLNSEGCGYVAIINTIFNEYVGREDEFEKAFGFPMYNERGEVNFDLMLVDFYSAMDNHNSLFGWDVNWAKEDSSKTKGYGTTATSREYRWEKYLEDRGINVDVHDTNVTVDNYNKISKNGEIIIAISPVIMYDENNKRIYSNGGHAMTITGVTDDGRFIVSSWGDTYYVDPTDDGFKRINYQQVSY